LLILRRDTNEISPHSGSLIAIGGYLRCSKRDLHAHWGGARYVKDLGL
jgi:hypothetical protein